ncbi:hypothetical protein HKD37_U058450 [Glycine soja]
MIGRADIEGSKKQRFAMNAWLPSSPKLSLWVTFLRHPSSFKFRRTKGSGAKATLFTVCIRTGNQNQTQLLPFCSTRDFCSPLSPHLGHHALSFQQMCRSAKLPTSDNVFLALIDRAKGLLTFCPKRGQCPPPSDSLE